MKADKFYKREAKNGVYYYQRRDKNNITEYEHRRIAENALGKKLPDKSVVHHHNGYEKNKTTLVICENQAYHILLHQRMRALKECGNVNLRKCCICKKYDSIDNLYFNRGTAAHRKCKSYIEKIRNRKTGYLTPDQIKQFRSINMKEKWKDEDFKKSQSKKISVKVKEAWDNPEIRAKMCKSMIGRKFPPVSQEQRKIRSENMKRIWEERKQNANTL